MRDLVIIGAGPVGCRLASLCSPDADVLVLEEHRAPGGKACSGLVSPRFLGLLPRSVAECPGLIEHKVRGARVHIGGETLAFAKSGTAAYIIDRGLLDRGLAAFAAGAGCDIRYGERVTGISMGKGCARVATEKGVRRCRLVAGCDGARSLVSSAAGDRSREILTGLIAAERREDCSDTVDIWYDARIAKDGFLWRIPRGPAGTEYGGMGSGLKLKYVVEFFRLHGRKLETSAAPIPIGMTKTVSDRLILAGDAACQTKPWSGGGLTYGLLAAQCAAKVISACLEKDDFSAAALSEYESLWKATLLSDMQAGLMAREMLRDRPELLTGLAKALGRGGGGWEKIDFDFPFSSLIGASGPDEELLLRPGFRRSASGI